MKQVLNLNDHSFKAKDDGLTDTQIVVGYDSDDKPVIMDFSKCDNLVITGKRGSGKSNLLYDIVSELLSKNSSHAIELYAMQHIDSNVLSFGHFNYEQIICPSCKKYNLNEVLEDMTSCIEELERKVRRRISIVSDIKTELKNTAIDTKEMISLLPLVIVVIDDLTFLANENFAESNNKLRIAFLECLERILKLNKDLRICIIQAEISSDETLPVSTSNESNLLKDFNDLFM